MKIILKEIELCFPSLSFSEMNILHLSDLHLAGENSRIEEAFKRELQNKEYDFIFLTGDLIDADTGIDPLIYYLSYLNSRYGTFCVWGNHDKFNLKLHHAFTFNHKTRLTELPMRDIETLRERLSSQNINVLVDELERIDIGQDQISIIGVDDWLGADRLQNWQHHAVRIHKLKKMINEIPEDNFIIFLTHMPDVIELFTECRINMVFSGHTHGGQICLPFIGPIFTWSKFQRKYHRGLHQYNGSYMHISPGLGTSCMPLRFMCPPEITQIKIRANG